RDRPLLPGMSVVPIDPENAIPLVAVAVTTGLYWAGWRRRVRPATGPDLRSRQLRACAFAGAMAVLLIALVGLDGYADRGFWPHMLQRVLLLTAAAPLRGVAEPWSMLWRPLPLGFRRSSAGWVARSSRARPGGSLGRVLGRPVPRLGISPAGP